jgi:hypothetical protein
LQLPVHGHPLHTRSLTVVVRLLDNGHWHARGDVIDLRKVGFVPMMSDIQPAGIIHRMSIDLEVDPATARIESVEVDQPVVAIEPSTASRGECCRDPAPRLLELAGETLDGRFARQLGAVFGGSHLLTLFQLMSSGLQRAIPLEAALGEGASAREVGDPLFRRAVFVDGFEGEGESIEMAVQLADFHTLPLERDAPPTQRLGGQWDARVFVRASGPERRLSDLCIADRERSHQTLTTATWRDASERLAPLVDVPIVPGLARRLFEIFQDADDGLMLDAALQLAPGYIQVMAAVMDRWISQKKQDEPERVPVPGRSTMVEVGNIGGLPDSCYMWRSEGPLVQMRTAPYPVGTPKGDDD